MARTSPAAPGQRPPRRPQGPSPAAPRPAGRDESPIYERLAREWAGSGRTLPGVPDREWARLIRYPELLRRPAAPRPPGRW
ncbi:hypothetical protein ABT354_18615 [Streptomyces sp. NPDC000594]|uniref:hypothetical protein n=1 Tax=Streptomyces sp. NPDC000594 TaxID=3154261 RepID=UPI003332728A